MNQAFNSKFTKEIYKWPTRVIIYPIPVIIKLIQIKTTVTYHFTPAVSAGENT